MSYWLYRDHHPLCQIHGLSDHRCRTGAIELAVPAAMIDDLRCLSAPLQIHNDQIDQCELIQCLRVRHDGFSLVLTAMALGS